VDILNAALESADHEKAHEAVSVLLMQCMTVYGPEHPVFQQLFPALDTIEKRIANSELKFALRQSRLFKDQLEEVKTIVREM